MNVGNTKYGDGALQKNTKGSNNSAFGICSSRDTDISWNTSVGAYANMSNVSGVSNTSVGTNAHLLNISGSYNTALGTATLLNNKSNSNTAVGSNTMEKNTDGKENVAVGVQAGYENTSGEKNVFIGSYAGFKNYDGSENIFLGNNSGNNPASNISIGSRNSFLGANTGIANTIKTYNNSTAIGYGSIIDASNQIMMGTSYENIIIPGNAYLTNLTGYTDYTEQSIVSKKYIDTFVTGGIQITKPSRCATTGPIDLNNPTGTTLIDTIPINEYFDLSRVLVRCQDTPINWIPNESTSSVDNGIYVYHYNSPSDVSFTRATDCSLGANVKGQATLIVDGSLNKSNIFVQTNYDVSTNQAIAGSYPLEYTQFVKLQFSIGDGLQITGDTLQVKPDITNTAGNPYLTNIGMSGTLSVGGDASFNSKLDVSGTLNVTNSDAYIRNIRIGYGGGDISSNVVIGMNSGNSNTSGDDNVFIGKDAGQNNIDGDNNTFIGRSAGQNNVSGYNNTFVGIGSGITSLGIENSFFGHSSGQYNKGSNNVCLGSFADAYGVISNSVAIGYDVKVDTSNTIVIGKASHTTQIPGGLELKKPLLMNDATNTNRTIRSTYYYFYDNSTNSLPRTTIGELYNTTIGQMTLYNYVDNGSISFYVKDSSATQLSPFQLFPSSVLVNKTLSVSANVNITMSAGTGIINQAITVGDLSTNILKSTNVSYNVNNSSGNGSPALSVTDNYSSNQFYFIPNNASGEWSPLVLPNNLTIIGRGANQNNATLVLTTYSSLRNGIKMISTSTTYAQTELWAGDNTSIILNNTTGISLTGDVSMNNKLKVTGDATFNSTMYVSGTLNVLNTDAYINSIRVGRGGGNSNTNTVIGRNSGNNISTGTYNTILGLESGQNITTGSSNLLIGQGSGRGISSGSSNVIIGIDNFYSLNCANSEGNVSIGNVSGYATTGNYNTFLGTLSARSYDGSLCTFVGYSTNYLTPTYKGGLGNTLLGSNSFINADDIQYSTAIGYGANVNTNNTIVIGTSSEMTQIPGKLNVLLDASFNSRVDVSGQLNVLLDASFNSRVDVSGQLTTRSRAYQELKFGPSWDDVNGYYGLAKDAYPALNPYSSGVKAVSTWTSRTSSNTDYEWQSVCWSAELSIFVAVGYNDKVMTSNDGINWTTITTNTNASWTSVCWSAELGIFVAVSHEGRIMQSSNGVIWNSPLLIDGQWKSICWSPELSLFIAVSNAGIPYGIIVSSDGTSWITYYTAPFDQLKSICWSPELGIFVAVSPRYNYINVATSTNGIVWNTYSTPSGGNEWHSVCWSSKLSIFVAVGKGGGIITSTNGTTWSLITKTSNNWSSVCWSDELAIFVAVSYSGGTDRVITSPDGINWTTRTTNNNNWNSVCWSPELGIFVSVSSTGTGNRMMTSSLKGRPPTSYNVFDSSFNKIDENGNWSFSGNLKYSTTYHTSSPTTLNTISKYSNTFDVNSGGTCTLTLVDSNNVGVQFLITNVNSSNLIVNTSSSQNIYSSTSPPSATTRTLAQYNSQIFTAIQTGLSNYGWSMV